MLIEPKAVDEDDVRRINSLITGVFPGVRDEGLLSAACARPVASVGGEWGHPGIAEQALSILDGIIGLPERADDEAVDRYVTDLRLKTLFEDLKLGVYDRLLS